MPTYLAPGVYIEEVPSGARPIEGAPTSNTAFVGFAARGPVGSPILITKIGDYDGTYGGVRDTGADPVGDPMGHALQAFFLNGGSKAYVFRVVGGSPSRAEGYLKHASEAGQFVRVRAINPGIWGNELMAELASVDPDATPVLYRVTINEFNRAQGSYLEKEVFTNLSFSASEPNYIEKQINGFSDLVEVAVGDYSTDDVSLLARGTSISDDISGVTITDLNGRQMTVTVDGDPIAVDFGASAFDGGSTWEDVAEAITSAIQASGVNPGADAFSCAFVTDHLVLTSGTRTRTSSVAVTGPGGSSDAAALLLLGGNEITGAEAFTAAVQARARDPYLRGSLASADLIDRTDFTSLLGTTMTVTAGTARTVTFNASNVDASTRLADIAEIIQGDVRGSTSNPATAGFECLVRDGRLVMINGAPGAGSAVAATGAAAADLGFDNANAQTGAEAYADPTVEAEDELTGGTDGSTPGVRDYQPVFEAMTRIRDISIVVLPGQSWSADPGAPSRAIVAQAIGHAERMQNRMVIVDPPVSREMRTEAQVSALGLSTSSHVAVYYPWLQVTNPHFDVERAPDRPRTVLVAPSGFAAGLWGRTDNRRGVWKAPAGLEANLIGAQGTQYVVERAEQEALNPVGVNCYRSIISDVVSWGARTRATRANPEWRYVPVRRTAIFLRDSIYTGIQWAVFEPNDHRLWSSLRLNIEAFMDTQFRAGAFQGEKASDAYSVRCGLGDTMAQADIDAGRVIVLVGFAPLKPAEFVIIRIQQKVGQQ